MSESTPTRTTGYSTGWLVVIAVLLVVGLGEFVGAEASGGHAAPSGLQSIFEGESARNAYGLTPIDVALLAEAASGQAGKTDTSFVVAGFPGVRRLDGPLLTLHPRPKELLSRGERKSVVVASASSQWASLDFDGKTNATAKPGLSRAEVYVADKKKENGEKRICPRTSLETFACGNPGWSHVQYRKVKISGNKQLCIWVHPLEGREIIVDFGQVPPRKAGGRYSLRTALDDRVVAQKGDVDVTVEYGDSIEHRHRSKRGWQQTELPTPEKPTRLVVRISAERVGRRHFCFLIH